MPVQNWDISSLFSSETNFDTHDQNCLWSSIGIICSVEHYYCFVKQCLVECNKPCHWNGIFFYPQLAHICLNPPSHNRSLIISATSWSICQSPCITTIQEYLSRSCFCGFFIKAYVCWSPAIGIFASDLFSGLLVLCKGMLPHQWCYLKKLCIYYVITTARGPMSHEILNSLQKCAGVAGGWRACVANRKKMLALVSATANAKML